VEPACRHAEEFAGRKDEPVAGRLRHLKEHDQLGHGDTPFLSVSAWPPPRRLLISDDLAGSPLGDDYPELAVCEVCGRAVEWPNGKPTLVRREQE
jgi:hypothetical protein